MFKIADQCYFSLNTVNNVGILPSQIPCKLLETSDLEEVRSPMVHTVIINAFNIINHIQNMLLPALINEAVVFQNDLRYSVVTENCP